MLQSWRWFGPPDRVSIDEVMQAGATGVVTALHHIKAGQVWTPDEIAKRQREVATMSDGAPSGLIWAVAESLPVSEDIKRQTGDYRQHFANYRESLKNMAAAGVEVICYNFMPVLDWTRTDLRYRLSNGATCMRFDLMDFAAYDIHILKRPGARESFAPEVSEEADRRFAAMDDQTRKVLAQNVMGGLPGSADNLQPTQVMEHLNRYADMNENTLRQHLVDFLSEVAPTADELGLRLCCHPDDPPFPLLGLPRVMSTEDHYAKVMAAVDIPANGITLCSGSLGARPDNDLPAMMRRFGPRVHFLHLRNVKRETPAQVGSFYEAAHLEGDTNMVDLIIAIHAEEKRRAKEGRKDAQIPMRPDHGQDILDDHKRMAQPGYPAIGRLKGLAELRGIELAVKALA
jgi:mannonate dehydratase